MPVLAPGFPVALNITGDLGGVTYAQKGVGRRTVYAKTYPARVPTEKQLAARARFTAALRAWQALSTEQKATLDRICVELGMVMSGMNLYIGVALWKGEDVLTDWASQIGLSFP